MFETAVVFLLSVTSVCLVIITGALFVTAKELHRTLRRLDPLVAQGDHAIRETRKTIGQARELLTRTNTTARQVETVVLNACEVATNTLEGFIAFKAKVESMVSGFLGNGAHQVRGDPRRNARREHQ